MRERMIAYGRTLGNLYVIVLSLKPTHHLEQSISPETKIREVSFFAPWNLIGLLRRQKKFDIITTQDPFETGCIGFLVSRWFRIRFHVQLHTDMFSPYFRKESWRNRVRVILGTFIIRQADSVRVVSQRLETTIVEKLAVPKARICVLPIFVGPTSGSLAPRGQKTVLAVGRLSTEKNLFFLVDVFRAALQKVPESKLIIVGDGPLRGKLEAYIRERGLEKYVTLALWQASPEAYYNRASVFLHTAFYEGYGMALVEAGMHNLPIVTSDVGIAREVYGHTKSVCICPVNDLDCFVSGLVSQLSEDSSTADSQHAAREHLPYTKEEYLRKYKEALLCDYSLLHKK